MKPLGGKYRSLNDIWDDINKARHVRDPAEYERLIEPLVDELWATEKALGVAGKDPRTR